MHILKINPITQNNYYKKDKKNNNIKFKAHPDFDKLAKVSNITASSYFRRGPVYGSPSDKYEEIVDIFKNLLTKENKLPQKMLIVGIGNSQEPFSYLATIQDIIKDKNLKSVLDLYTVDLQSKPTTQKLFYDSFYDDKFEPIYAQSSFVYNKTPYYNRYIDSENIANDSSKEKKYDCRINLSILKQPTKKGTRLSAFCYAL